VVFLEGLELAKGLIGHLEQAMCGPLQGKCLPEVIWTAHGNDWPGNARPCPLLRQLWPLREPGDRRYDRTNTYLTSRSRKGRLPVDILDPKATALSQCKFPDIERITAASACEPRDSMDSSDKSMVAWPAGRCNGRRALSGRPHISLLY